MQLITVSKSQSALCTNPILKKEISVPLLAPHPLQVFSGLPLLSFVFNCGKIQEKNSYAEIHND
jgi:hypothetical protein